MMWLFGKKDFYGNSLSIEYPQKCSLQSSMFSKTNNTYRQLSHIFERAFWRKKSANKESYMERNAQRSAYWTIWFSELLPSIKVIKNLWKNAVDYSLCTILLELYVSSCDVSTRGVPIHTGFESKSQKLRSVVLRKRVWPKVSRVVTRVSAFQ